MDRQGESYKEAKDTALRRLGRRESSSQEMYRYLCGRGVAEDVAAAVVAELVERKWIDDERYARILVRHQAARTKGAAYIRMKLREKGVDLEPAQVQELVREVSPVSELESARQLVERKYPEADRDHAVAQKAYVALVRRGFSFEVARAAIKALK